MPVFRPIFMNSLLLVYLIQEEIRFVTCSKTYFIKLFLDGFLWVNGTEPGEESQF